MHISACARVLYMQICLCPCSYPAVTGGMYVFVSVAKRVCTSVRNRESRRKSGLDVPIKGLNEYISICRPCIYVHFLTTPPCDLSMLRSVCMYLCVQQLLISPVACPTSDKSGIVACETCIWFCMGNPKAFDILLPTPPTTNKNTSSP